MQYFVTPKNHGLGWIPDKPDERDLIFKPTPGKLAVAPLPPVVDLRKECPKVYNQGTLGSCTANALAAAFDFDRHREGDSFMTPSRLFIYYNERAMEGTTTTDAGASIRDGVKTLKSIGVIPETEWPYIIADFTEKPSPQCYQDAKKAEALTYARILRPTENPNGDMVACLAQGDPFVVGINVYESFESPHSVATGIIPMPKPGEKLLGGHAILVVGYEQAKKQFICRNSWGAAWGDKGYFYLPYAYLADEKNASDLWVVKTVEV